MAVIIDPLDGYVGDPALVVVIKLGAVMDGTQVSHRIPFYDLRGVILPVGKAPAPEQIPLVGHAPPDIGIS